MSYDFNAIIVVNPANQTVLLTNNIIQHVISPVRYIVFVFVLIVTSMRRDTCSDLYTDAHRTCVKK